MTEPHKNSAGRRWAEEGRVAGKASRIILHFRTAYKWGRKVILWCRESDEKNKGHLTDQFLELWDACVRLGAEVVGVIFDVFYGYVTDPGWKARILKAEEMARRQNAILLATEPNRFVRNELVRTNDEELWDLQANEAELDVLGSLTSGVVLMTLCPPDVSPSDERSLQTKRGLRAGAMQSAKPSEMRTHWKPIAIAMWKAKVGLEKEIFSVRKIAKYLGQKKSTIHDWISQPAK